MESERPTGDDLGPLELPSESRIYRLREMYWRRMHNAALIEKDISGSDRDTLVGHALDFAALLAASEPFIQEDELIIGCHLALPMEPSTIDLGYYDRHFPPGHETILHMGLPGIRDDARHRLEVETDANRKDFLESVAITYDAACEYVHRHALHAGALAAQTDDPLRRADLNRIADVCDELATAPPSSFRAALQLVQFTRVFGGSGCIGRFDQWMLPYYRRDVLAGKLEPDQAQELIESFFIKLNHFATLVPKLDPALEVEITPNDSLRNITLAGQTPQGSDACNELTYLCLSAAGRLMLPEPKLNVRFFPGSPQRLMRACCLILARGANVLSIYNDEVAVPALLRLGIPIEDARDYCNDGCSELIIGGKCFTCFKVDDSLTVLRDTVLHAGEQPYLSFRDVMDDLNARLRALAPDGSRGAGAITFPYFAASIEDCLQQASPAGARYSIWGSILGEVGNTADGLAAIRQCVYDQGIITWSDLVSAVRDNYDGHEPLRQMLRTRPPKYGNDRDMVDGIAKEVVETFCDAVHSRAGERPGPGAKEAVGFMLFGIQSKRNLPATPDGRRQGDLVASSISPAVGADRSGPTAVLRSAAKLDLSKASYGSVLDLAMHTSAIRGSEGFGKFVALMEGFLRLPSTATLQVNVVDRDTLMEARNNPHSPQYRTLMVRVWGFSAVFVELPPALQDHVLARTEHVLTG